jgi:ribose transport system substrate-binding protein
MPSLARCIVLISALAVASCGRQVAHEPQSGDAARPAATGGQQIKVALIMKAQNNPFFLAMEEGAKHAQQETRIALTTRFIPEETAVEQQITLVDDAIKAHVDALVIAPVDSHRLVPIIKKAYDAGIKIVNVDNRLDAADMKQRNLAGIPFISIDNEHAAYQSAKYAADQITDESEAAVIEGIRSADNANLRKRGALRAFAANPKLRVTVQESANWNADEAYAVAKRVFPIHPKLKVVFCANDSMAFGIIKYLKENSRHDVKIASFDALATALDAIRSGDLVATIDQQADKQGYEGIKTAIKAVKGEALAPDIELDAALITAKSLKAK